MQSKPYDIQSYGEVAPLLTAAGCRVIVPYLRGYGTTRFLSDDTLRNGEQAALGDDLITPDGLARDRDGNHGRPRLHPTPPAMYAESTESPRSGFAGAVTLHALRR